jgi:hypothetical protein
MPLRDLSQGEQDVVLQAFGYILERLDEADADTRVGVTLDALRAMKTHWPPDDAEQTGEAFLAINNVLNETCNGPDAPAAGAWLRCVGVRQEELRAIYVRWARSHGLSWTGIR